MTDLDTFVKALLELCRTGQRYRGAFVRFRVISCVTWTTFSPLMSRPSFVLSPLPVTTLTFRLLTFLSMCSPLSLPVSCVSEWASLPASLFLGLWIIILTFFASDSWTILTLAFACLSSFLLNTLGLHNEPWLQSDWLIIVWQALQFGNQEKQLLLL